MTGLSKAVTRRSEERVRDGSRSRRIIVTLYPNGTIGLRPEKTRREEVVSLAAVWSLGVKQRIAAARAAKIAVKKAKKGKQH